MSTVKRQRAEQILANVLLFRRLRQVRFTKNKLHLSLKKLHLPPSGFQLCGEGTGGTKSETTLNKGFYSQHDVTWAAQFFMLKCTAQKRKGTFKYHPRCNHVQANITNNSLFFIRFHIKGVSHSIKVIPNALCKVIGQILRSHHM